MSDEQTSPGKGAANRQDRAGNRAGEASPPTGMVVSAGRALEPAGDDLSLEAAARDLGQGGEAVEEVAPPESPEALPLWSELSISRRQAIVEAMIFASEQPLSLKDLREVLGVSRAELLQIIERIREELERHHRGLVLEEVAGGYVFRTRIELAPWLRALIKTRPPRLSRAALECLAIVAYRQPVTRAEVEEVRGVESGNVLRSLLEKRLVRILGRKEDVGRPMIYGTTREFLQMFGLRDLTGLPTLRDLSALMGKSQGPTPETVDEEQPLAMPAGRIGPLIVKPVELPDDVPDDAPESSDETRDDTSESSDETRNDAPESSDETRNGAPESFDETRDDALEPPGETPDDTPASE